MVDFAKLAERLKAERADPILKLIRLSEDLAKKALKSQSGPVRYDGMELLECITDVKKSREASK